MASTPEEVLTSLTPPPKNIAGKDSEVVNLLVTTWISECAGKCSVAGLTQLEINAVFWSWLKKAKYTDLILNHMVKKLLKRPRTRQTQEVTQEMLVRRTILAAAKLHGKVAVITGNKIVEKGSEAGDTQISLAETWKQSGAKPRNVISDMMEDIQRQMLIESMDDDDDIAADAA
jgi:hypothetical protein